MQLSFALQSIMLKKLTFSNLHRSDSTFVSRSEWACCFELRARAANRLEPVETKEAPSSTISHKGFSWLSTLFLYNLSYLYLICECMHCIVLHYVAHI